MFLIESDFTVVGCWIACPKALTLIHYQNKPIKLLTLARNNEFTKFSGIVLIETRVKLTEVKGSWDPSVKNAQTFV